MLTKLISTPKARKIFDVGWRVVAGSWVLSRVSSWMIRSTMPLDSQTLIYTLGLTIVVTWAVLAFINKKESKDPPSNEA